MIQRSEGRRRADSTLAVIDRVLREPADFAPSAVPEVPLSALSVAVAANRYQALAQAAMQAVRNYGHGAPFPLAPLVDELREVGLLPVGD